MYNFISKQQVCSNKKIKRGLLELYRKNCFNENAYISYLERFAFVQFELFPKFIVYQFLILILNYRKNGYQKKLFIIKKKKRSKRRDCHQQVALK